MKCMLVFTLVFLILAHSSIGFNGREVIGLTQSIESLFAMHEIDVTVSFSGEIEEFSGVDIGSQGSSSYGSAVEQFLSESSSTVPGVSSVVLEGERSPESTASSSTGSDSGDSNAATVTQNQNPDRPHIEDLVLQDALPTNSGLLKRSQRDMKMEEGVLQPTRENEDYSTASEHAKRMRK